MQQWLAACYHYKFGFAVHYPPNQIFHAASRMFFCIPAVFYVTPPAVYITPGKPDKVCCASGMSSFTLNGIKIFHQGIFGLIQLLPEFRTAFIGVCGFCLIHLIPCIQPSLYLSPKPLLSARCQQEFLPLFPCKYTRLFSRPWSLREWIH